MKNIIQQNHTGNSNYGIFSYKKMEAKILDFKPDNEHYILKLRINNLNNDNYKLVIKNNHLSVILFETIEFNRPVHSHNFKLDDLGENASYDELKSIDFTLPESNYYLIGHTAIPHNGILKIILGRIYHN